MILSFVVGRGDDDVVVLGAEGFVDPEGGALPVDSVRRQREALHVFALWRIVTGHVPRLENLFLCVEDYRRGHAAVLFPRRFLFEHGMRAVLLRLVEDAHHVFLALDVVHIDEEALAVVE